MEHKVAKQRVMLFFPDEKPTESFVISHTCLDAVTILYLRVNGN